MSVKSWEIVFSLWIKKSQIHEKLKVWIRQSLGFSDKINFEYKAHPKKQSKEKEEEKQEDR
jgi:hypothetical protein